MGQLFYLQGKHRTETDKIAAGDLGAAVKLKNAHVGDTLCDKSNPVKIPATDYPKPSIFSAISAASKGDEDKIGTGLNRLKEEDPSFDVRVDSEVRQTLISGQGELHLDVIVGTDNVDSEVARLESLGATRLSERIAEAGTEWIVMADPEGNEFCICAS